jgi:hypothetical protein
MYGRKRGRPGGKVELAVQWFRENGMESGLEACAQALGISIGTAKNARTRLKNVGLLPVHFSPNDPGAGSAPVRKVDSPHDPQATPRPVGASPPPAPLDSENFADLEKELGRSLSDLPQQDALTRAWEMHNRSNSEQIKVATLRIIANLTGTDEEKKVLGPGPPLTLDQRLHRGALVLQACGRENLNDVVRRAFNEEIVGTNKLPPLIVQDDIPEAALPDTLPPGAPLVMAPDAA